jgi:hypothetical protein
MRYEVLGEFAKFVADGTSRCRIARMFPTEDWRAALDVDQSQKAHGELNAVIAFRKLMAAFILAL